MDEFGRTGVLDARGVRISGALLREIMEAAPPRSSETPWDTRFDHAVFEEAPAFDDVTFGESASFAFVSILHGETSFREASFRADVSFERAAFADPIYFFSCHFKAAGIFDGVLFEAEAIFDTSLFAEELFETNSSRSGAMSFVGAEFRSSSSFSGVSAVGSAEFRGTRFGDDARIGPLSAIQISFDSSVFSRNPVLELVAQRIDLNSTTFPAGGVVRIHAGDIYMERSYFGEPTVLGRANPSPAIGTAWVGDPNYPPADMPRVLSMVNCNCDKLTISALDLRTAHFIGAFGLDLLRIDGPVVWAHQPSGRMWSRRRVIAEEINWRVQYQSGSKRQVDWKKASAEANVTEVYTGPASPLNEQAARASARDVERLYRALRKGLEDGKNEPGAADFYYGEMEMRRAGAAPRSVEKGLLQAYWLMSGYGLRAWRAVSLLVAILLLSTLVFWTVGLARSTHVEYLVRQQSASSQVVSPRQVSDDGRSFHNAIVLSLESATSLLRGLPATPVTGAGEDVEIALRLIGPVLLGFAILSVRGRVKR